MEQAQNLELLKNEQSAKEPLKAKMNERYALAAIEVLEWEDAYEGRKEIEKVLYEWLSTFKSKRKYRSDVMHTFGKIFEFIDEIKKINEETSEIRKLDQEIRKLEVDAIFVK